MQNFCMYVCIHIYKYKVCIRTYTNFAFTYTNFINQKNRRKETRKPQKTKGKNIEKLNRGRIRTYKKETQRKPKERNQKAAKTKEKNRIETRAPSPTRVLPPPPYARARAAR
jgi:ATPase subunit of ABC transporter with duplicated ATPase domains